MLAAKAPGAVSFSVDEAWRINRARMAWELHKLPSELDDANVTDIADLMAVKRADDEIAAWDAGRKQRLTARSRRKGRR